MKLRHISDKILKDLRAEHTNQSLTIGTIKYNIHDTDFGINTNPEASQRLLHLAFKICVHKINPSKNPASTSYLNLEQDTIMGAGAGMPF